MPDALSSCPATDTLEALALGADPDTQLSAHLVACQPCQDRLQQIRADNDFLREYASETGLPTPAPDGPAALTIPGYHVLREIERGGQGVVYVARQESTQREVAIKVLRRGALATSQDRARFDREVETLGRLDHPNVVTVHDAGEADGCKYVVMDLVDGLALDDWARVRRQQGTDTSTPLRDVLELFITICDAVHAAHLRGVMHRDLKPGNIRVDRQGRPHVLDFGLAKPLDGMDVTSMTRTGQFVGSLLWASPEQVAGASDQVDLRTDVYSLGVILFQLLTGRVPFDLDSNLRATLDEILTSPPPRPSSIPGVLPGCDDELDTIIQRCLAKDPPRRYQGAGELARDLRRYLAGEPIEAKRDSAMYVLRKTLHRYRLRVALAGTAVTLTAIFAVVMTLMYQRSAHLEREAIRNAESFSRLLTQSNIERGRLAGVLGSFTQSEQLLWSELLTSRNPLDQALRITEPPGAPQAYWALWNLYRQHPCLRTIPLEPRPRTAAVLTDHLLTIDAAGTLHAFEPGGTPRSTTKLPAAEAVGLPQAHHTGQLALSTTERYIVWQLGTDQPLFNHVHQEGTAANARLSPSGRLLAIVSEGRAVIVDVDSGRQRLQCGDDIAAFAFSHDDQRIATRDRRGALVIWGIADGRPLLQLPQTGPERVTPQAVDLAFAPGDQLLADAWIGRPGRLIQLDQPEPRIHPLAPAGGAYRVLAFSPDARHLALGDFDGNVRVFDERGQRLAEFNVADRVRSLSFAPDGASVWVCTDNSLRRWELSGNRHVTVHRIAGEPHFHAVEVAPDWLAAAGGSGQIHILHAGASDWRSVNLGLDTIIPSLARATDGTLAAATYSGEVIVWQETGQGDLPRDALRLAHPNHVSHVRFSPDGSLLATACDDGQVRIWNRDAALLSAFSCGGQRLPQIAFNRTSQQLAIAGRDGSVWTWDRATEQVQSLAAPTPQPMRAVAYATDRLLTAGADRVVSIWDPDRRERVARLPGPTHEIYCLDVSPDEQLLASGDAGGSIHLWHLPDRVPLLVLEGHTAAVMSLRFASPTQLVSASLDGTVRQWNLDHYREHVAGQVASQLRRLQAESTEPTRASAWLTWSRRILAEPE